MDQETVEKMLLSLSKHASPGIDNLDGMFLKMASGLLCEPMCHILCKCILTGTCPELWKEAKRHKG